MNDWAKANLGPRKVIVLPDGTEREVEDLQLPSELAEKELPSSVKGGAFGHVPTDMKMVSCPGCKMDLLAIQQRCNACGWTRPK